MDHPRPWLRYLDAGAVDGKIEFDGMTVHSVGGETLGDLDGFIVDVSSGRPYYAVVDGGGWFKSKFFLLPIGHVGLDIASRKLVADVERERVQRYPGFDRDAFEKLSDDELNRMDEQMMAACCPDEAAHRTGTSTRLDRRAHYASPSWWDADFYRPDRADTTAKEIAGLSRQ